MGYKVAICDHFKREIIEIKNFDTRTAAITWATKELSGWKEIGDKIVIEERINRTELMIETASGCLDFYAEIHKIN